MLGTDSCGSEPYNPWRRAEVRGDDFVVNSSHASEPGHPTLATGVVNMENGDSQLRNTLELPDRFLI